MDYTKSELRKKVRAMRAPATIDWSRLYSLPEFQRAKVITSYISYENEPDTQELNREIINQGKILLLPRISDGEGSKLENIEWVRWSGDLSSIIHLKKIPEPLGPIWDGDIDLAILPALYISDDGQRLGQGGGFYDRWLAQSEIFTIALVNDEEFGHARWSREDHDREVSAVLTPKRFHRFS